MSHTHTDDSGIFACPMGSACQYKKPLKPGSLVCVRGSERVIIGRIESRPYDFPKHWLVRFNNGSAQIMHPSDFME